MPAHAPISPAVAAVFLTFNIVLERLLVKGDGLLMSRFGLQYPDQQSLGLLGLTLGQVQLRGVQPPSTSSARPISSFTMRCKSRAGSNPESRCSALSAATLGVQNLSFLQEPMPFFDQLLSFGPNPACASARALIFSNILRTC